MGVLLLNLMVSGAGILNLYCANGNFDYEALCSCKDLEQNLLLLRRSHGRVESHYNVMTHKGIRTQTVTTLFVQTGHTETTLKSSIYFWCEVFLAERLLFQRRSQLWNEADFEVKLFPTQKNDIIAVHPWSEFSDPNLRKVELKDPSSNGVRLVGREKLDKMAISHAAVFRALSQGVAALKISNREDIPPVADQTCPHSLMPWSTYTSLHCHENP